MTRVLPDVGRLPGRRWAGSAFEVSLAPGGVVLGRDAAGPVAVPLVGPSAQRVALVGSHALAMVVAHRLVGAGIHVTVVTARRELWGALSGQLDPQSLAVVHSPGSWPDSIQHWPRVLLVDLPTPPPSRWGYAAEWSTVLHVSQVVPPNADWWRSADQILVGGPGYGAAVAQVRPEADRRELDSLAPEALAIVTRSGTRACTVVLSRPEATLIA